MGLHARHRSSRTARPVRDLGGLEREPSTRHVANTLSRSLLEDEAGRWQGTGRWVNGGGERYSFYVLIGEGAYAGLYALLHGVTPAGAEGPWDLAYEGYIFEAEMLPFPDGPVPDMTEGQPLYPFPTGPPDE